jgi:phenylalanyl-tRNA synthetase alpha chain
MKSNIPQSINSKIENYLHNKKNHPIEIIKRKIYDYFGAEYEKFDDLNPIVPIEDNFDKLLIPKDHPARSMSDTYYYDEKRVLRTHTSAHQNDLLSSGHKKFLVVGNVFRKDDIDFCHYPIFFQMEGVNIVDDNQDPEVELKKTLSGLMEYLFPNCEYRFSSDYFPFTEPSFEVEVLYNGKWMEVLGCGVIHKQILTNCGLENKKGFAFGLGLDRLCMNFFEIPDIRFLWSEDERFIKQFESGDIVKFKPYSDYPKAERDIAFWISDKFNHNGFCEIVRENGGDIVENVSIVDEFTNSKTNKTSKCYRIVYRSNDRTLTGEEINSIQENIKKEVISELEVTIR